jgi:predicted lactoylglutathione lyase
MNAKSIYINLPIKNLNNTKDFWTKLGFSFNPKFSNEKGLCLILNEGNIYSMLLTEEFFSTFTNRPPADGKSTEVLIAIEVENREKVDEIIKLAITNGGSRYREIQEFEWMHNDAFTDPDGHQWEVFCINESKIPQ